MVAGDVVTDGSEGQLVKKLAGSYEELLEPGMGDRRSVMRLLGNEQTTKIDSLRGSRSNLPPGGRSGEVWLGSL